MISEIFPLTKNKFELILLLYLENELNLTLASEKLNMSVQQVSRTFKEIESIIEIKKFGKIKIYSLKKEVENLFELLIEKYRLEKSFKINVRLFNLIKNAISDSNIYVYGSYAKNLQNETSDLDLIIITEMKKKDAEEKIKIISKLISINIEAMIMNKKELEIILNDKNSTYNHIINTKSERIKVFN